MRKRIQFLAGIMSFMLIGSMTAFGQSGDGHNQKTILSYTPSGFTTNTYMLQQTNYNAIAKNTINNEGASTTLFVNYTYNTTGKNVFIVYTTDGSSPSKSNGTSVSMSFSNYSNPNSTFSGVIPSSANVEGNTVKYVFYISNSDLASAYGRVAGSTGYTTSWTEGDDFYSYEVYSASKSSGDFSDTATWKSGSVPVSNPIEIISPNSVTLDVNYTGVAISILNGATFTASDATPRTLTIANSASGSQATFTNNGTWTNGTGGSTVVFTGAPSSGDTQHQIAGSSSTAFQNVTINKTGGSNNVGADFQTGTSVTGTLRIGYGGFVATAPPSSFYGSSAILDFNQGGSANYEVNNGDKSWSTTEVPNNITITTGTVTLNEERTLTGELLIQSGATLVTNGNFNLASGGVLSNNGTITGDINFLTQLTGAAGFRMLSSPTTSSYSDLLDAIWTQGATGADTDQGNPNVFTWDRTTDAWEGVTNPGANIVAGTGLLAYVYADDDYDGAGTATWPKTLSVTGTENAVDAEPILNSTADGWTLVGNPFATTIDFDDVTKTDLTDVVYVWDPNSEGGNGGKNSETTAGSWKTYNGSSGDITGGLIASFQGFFVQNNETADSPSITFGAASKSTGGTFLGKANKSTFAKARLEVSGESVANSMWLQLSENGSAISEVMGDAVELQPLSTSFAELAAIKGGELFDIAHLPIGEKVNLPISFKTTETGVYTFTASNLELPTTMKLVFHDYETGEALEIIEDFSYEFEAKGVKSKEMSPLKSLQNGPIHAKATGTNRFGITIEPGTPVSNEDELATVTEFALEQNYPNPFNPTTTIKYSVGEAGPVSLTVYNVMGQKVAELLNTTKTAGTYQVNWNATGQASGIYYYRLQSPGQVITRQMTLIK